MATSAYKLAYPTWSFLQVHVRWNPMNDPHKGLLKAYCQCWSFNLSLCKREERGHKYLLTWKSDGTSMSHEQQTIQHSLVTILLVPKRNVCVETNLRILSFQIYRALYISKNIISANNYCDPRYLYSSWKLAHFFYCCLQYCVITAWQAPPGRQPWWKQILTID